MVVPLAFPICKDKPVSLANKQTKTKVSGRVCSKKSSAGERGRLNEIRHAEYLMQNSAEATKVGSDKSWKR